MNVFHCLKHLVPRCYESLSGRKLNKENYIQRSCFEKGENVKIGQAGFKAMAKLCKDKVRESFKMCASWQSLLDILDP